MEEKVPAGWRVHVHCFTSRRDLAEWAVGRGAFIGFTGVVSFASASDTRLVASTLPLDHFLLETDAPLYVSPSPSPSPSLLYLSD
jgi:TatD DNase family protein